MQNQFNLITLLKKPEYVQIKLSDILEEIINKYYLQQKALPDGWVYLTVIHGMYSLPQVGSLGHDLLEECLNFGLQSKIVPGLWKHNTCKTKIVLVVDNFGIKNLKQENFDHLINSLKSTTMLPWIQMEKLMNIILDWDKKEEKCMRAIAKNFASVAYCIERWRD